MHHVLHPETLFERKKKWKSFYHCAHTTNFLSNFIFKLCGLFPVNPTHSKTPSLIVTPAFYITASRNFHSFSCSGGKVKRLFVMASLKIITTFPFLFILKLKTFKVVRLIVLMRWQTNTISDIFLLWCSREYQHFKYFIPLHFDFSAWGYLQRENKYRNKIMVK